MARQRKHFVQSLARGIPILQAFSSQRNRLTLTELSEITGINRTAVQRFTDTLMEMGFLDRNKHKEFYLGPKILSLVLYSIATPVLNHERRVITSTNLSLSSEKATGTVLTDAIREIVEQGRDLSKLLGYEGVYPLIVP